MKFLAFINYVISFLIFVRGEMFSINFNNHLSLIEAVSEVVEKVLSKHSENINLISFEMNSHVLLRDFVGELLIKLSQNSSTKIQLESETQKLNTNLVEKKLCTIFVGETYRDFLKSFSKHSLKSFKLNGLFLIVSINGEIPEILKFFEILWKLHFFNVNFIFEETNEKISVKTFMPFSNRNWNNTKPILINEFKGGKFKNETKNFFPDKMKNLHNRPIRVAVAAFSKPYVIEEFLPDESYRFSGLDISLIETLSESLNFKIDYTFFKSVGYIYENGSATESFKALLNNETDVMISGWQLKAYRLNFFDTSTSYWNEKVVFVVPSGKSFTSFEQLVYPFQLLLWMTILSCFVIGGLVIFVIETRSKRVMNFVFGTDVRHPYLNMFIAFIGGSQIVLPRRNFARFLLMIFLMYSLIIRTLYQGSYFELLKSNKRHKEVQSIDEMIENDFKFYSVPGYFELVRATKAIGERLTEN